MKNITVSVDDEIYRRARIKAAERDTSVSALVRQFLIDVARNQTETAQLKREEAAILAAIRNFRAADRLSRDVVHLRLAGESFADWDDPEAERAFRDF